MRRIALLAAVLAFLAGPAAACLVCIELPEHTLADRVIGAEEVVLARPDPEAMRAAALALATLAEGGDPGLRAGIDAAFRDLAMHRPALAGEAANHLLWAEDWSQAGNLEALLATGAVSDPAAEFVITGYVAAAREALGPILQ